MNKTLKNTILFPFNLLYKLSPFLTIRLLFRLKCKHKLDLATPKSYNEKLNWLKLYYRNELMPLCADKYAVRKYIIDSGYVEYLPELLWYGKNPDDIPFDKLPDSFVIKSTTGSGNNIICKNKDILDIGNIRKQLKKMLKEKYLPCYGEWHYEKIEPGIIIEELLSDGVNFVPIDYKFFCFNNIEGGSVGCIALDLDRYTGHKRNIYDSEWNFMSDVSFGFERKFDAGIPKPEKFDEMKNIAAKLAEPFPHCRVDFYVIGEKFYIGELTFFNGSGFDLVTPKEYNLKMGNWIQLPQKNN